MSTRSTVEKNRMLVARVLVCLILACMVLIPLAGCSSPKVEEVKAQSFEVGFAGVVPAESGTTYGSAVERYAPGGKWSSGNSYGGQSIVNYEGGKASDGTVNIQWVEGSDGWSVWAMELDGQAVPMLNINGFFSSGELL
jgi:hypothetical protein